MAGLLDLYAAHAFWFWAALAAVILAFEVGTGTGWLLWPTASAAAVAVTTAIVRLGFAGEVGLFALLTLVTTLLARRFWPRSGAVAADINDNISRLVGQRGRVAQTFVHRSGRVEVDGKEWPAEADSDLLLGAPVEVTEVRGSILRVRGHG